MTAAELFCVYWRIKLAYFSLSNSLSLARAMSVILKYIDIGTIIQSPLFLEGEMERRAGLNHPQKKDLISCM
jgi:hypothetical protein